MELGKFNRRGFIAATAAIPMAAAIPAQAETVERWTPERTRRELREMVAAAFGLTLAKSFDDSHVLKRSEQAILAHADPADVRKVFERVPSYKAVYEEFPAILEVAGV